MSIKNVLKRLSPIHIVALVCAVLIFAAVVTSAVFFGIGIAKDAKKEFDFTKNPEKYIEINYKEAFDIAPEYNKIRDVDINNKILALVAGEKNKNSGVSSEYDASTVINVGDEVKIYYRGLNDGVAFDGGCNFVGSTYSSVSAYNLSIGGDSFIAGFSLALDGKTVGDFPMFARERGVEVTSSHIAFVSYTRYPVTYNQYSGVETVGSVQSGTSVYVDLSGDLTEINNAYGAGFTDYLLGKAAEGENKAIDVAVANGENVLKTSDLRLTNAEGVEYKYTKIAVEYVMAADYYTNKDTNEKYDTIKVQFPVNYGNADLAGKDVEFQVLIESVKEFGYDYEGTGDCTMANAEFVDAMLKKALEDEEEIVAEVEALEGANFAEKYAKYLRAEDEEDNSLTYANAEYQAIIDALVAKSTLKLDGNKDLKSYVDAKYDASVITFLEAYANNGSNYASVEAYAEDVLDVEGCGEGSTYDWHKALRILAENYYKERLIVHYIIAEENLAGDYDAVYAAVCEKYSAAYRTNYAKQQDIDLDNMTENEAKKVRDAVNNYLSSSIGYEYLTERAHYQLVLDWYTTGAGAEYVTEK
jgi:FKBP-type peptidyl-prolyl cis-trans isomerase (trigger factor)